MPKNIAKYYHRNYWRSPGTIGKLKSYAFSLFQSRRKTWLKKYLKSGSVLEVGCGEGSFATSLDPGYKFTGLEALGAKIKNKNIIKTDFLKWHTNQKYDAIIFWESLEHVSFPQKYLEKAKSLLNKNGHILVELPRYGCLESKIFRENWFHLDPPRHLAHITKEGAKIIAKRAGLKLIESQNVLALEYSVWGLVASFLSFFNIESTDYLKKNKFPFFLVLLFPLIAISTFLTIILSFLKESPINFVALKNND